MKRVVFLLALVALLLLWLGEVASASTARGVPPLNTGGWVYGTNAVTINQGGVYELIGDQNAATNVQTISIATSDPVTLKLNGAGDALHLPSITTGLQSLTGGALILEITGPVSMVGETFHPGMDVRGDLTIRGDGILTVDGGLGGTYGLACGGALRLEDSVQVMATGSGDNGVRANSLTMVGTSRLTGTTDINHGVAIALAVDLSGDVRLTGFTTGAGQSGNGINCAALTISGTALAEGGTTGAGQSGISCAALTASGNAQVTGRANGNSAFGIHATGAVQASADARITGSTDTDGGAGLWCEAALTLADQARVTGIGPGVGGGLGVGLLLSGGNIPLLRGASPRLYVQNFLQDENHALNRDPGSTGFFLLGDGAVSADALDSARIRVSYPMGVLGWASVGGTPPPATAVPVGTATPGADVPPTGDGGLMGVYLAGLAAAIALYVGVSRRRRYGA